MRKEKRLTAVIFCAFFFMIFTAGCVKKPGVFAAGERESRRLAEFAPILQTYPNGVLSNRDGEKLRTQIITFSFAEGNKAYFCTTSDKPVYAQLVAFPYVSYCAFPEDFEPVLSINGKVVFIENHALKERALESNYYAKRNFKTIDNPLLKVFCIDVEEIETYGSEGPNVYAAARE